MILTALFTTKKYDIVKLDIRSGYVLRSEFFAGKRPASLGRTNTGEWYAEIDMDELVGGVLSTLSGDIKKGDYVVLRMKNKRHRLFPVAPADVRSIEENTETLRELDIEDYKSLLEFLKL